MAYAATVGGALKSSQADIVLNCVAKALKKDADSADLKDYVNGKKNLDDVGGNGKGSRRRRVPMPRPVRATP